MPSCRISARDADMLRCIAAKISNSFSVRSPKPATERRESKILVITSLMSHNTSYALATEESRGFFSAEPFGVSLAIRSTGLFYQGDPAGGRRVVGADTPDFAWVLVGKAGKP